MARLLLPALHMGAAATGVLLLVAIGLGAGDAIAASPAPDGVADDAPAASLVLALGERRLYVLRTDRPGGRPRAVESFPVAVGRRGYETPTGRFTVREKVTDPDFVVFDWDDPSRVIRRIAPGPDNPLGARWIGFAMAHGWTIGFHGTPHPELLGRAVSHGCVRMRNRDVVRLYDQVGIGTPVFVEP